MDSYIFDPPAQIPTPEHNGSDQGDQTAVSVLNLQLSSGAIAPNIWLEAKEQPALAAVKLWLRGSFASAASKDALDDSTVHYGELSKRVRAACASEEGQRTALDAALQAAEHMARKPRAGGDWFVASRIAAKLTLPKASAFGSSLVMNEARTYDERGARNGGFRTFFCQDLRVPTLIGVNAYERKGRQPVVVNFSVDFSGDRPGSLQDEMALLFPLERELVSIIEKTEFETLETLADYTLKELRTVFEERGVRPWVVHLKFEKPCAVPFADAPVIEVHRRWN